MEGGHDAITTIHFAYHTTREPEQRDGSQPGDPRVGPAGQRGRTNTRGTWAYVSSAFRPWGRPRRLQEPSRRHKCPQRCAKRVPADILIQAVLASRAILVHNPIIEWPNICNDLDTLLHGVQRELLKHLNELTSPGFRAPGNRG